MLHSERIYDLTPQRNAGGNVIYWMSREQRTIDNPGLLFAWSMAVRTGKDLKVVFTLTDGYPGANLRHYDFMLKGLDIVRRKLSAKNIPFFLLLGDPGSEISGFARENNTGTVVADFDPMRVKRQWIRQAIENSDAAFLEVDGHNIVPARYVSDKVEFGAYTLRPKIHRNLEKFLSEIPAPGIFEGRENPTGEKWPSVLLDQLNIDRSVPPVNSFLPGEDAALEVMNEFIENGIAGYAERRNDPNQQAVSNLSPYFHFGQLSSQRVAMEVMQRVPDNADRSAFLEEMIVRKELSDNFCLYNPDYDNVSGFHQWARTTHAEHRRDEREFVYSLAAFEEGRTHDSLWNAAQAEMVKTGKMHGYMRMYWAKKILEWTESVEMALEIAIILNDKYSLDGRDPNGYTGIAWSIGGVHDRAWTERPVFGKIRYMNANGCKRKFNVEEYIRRHLPGTHQKSLF